jgi:ketosteroid isomerase-like protein
MTPLALLVLGTLLAVEPMGESAARSTLDAWLAAQNQRQFEAYAALYADKFTGVKRSGSRTRRMDHDAWLKDRRGMFKKSMNVEISKVAITLAGGSANVSFVQRWSSGKYQDEGPKRLFLVQEAGRFRIAQEEMLSSTVESEYLATRSAMLVLDNVLVLSSRADSRWGIGPATADAGRVGHRAVADTRLPPTFKGLADQPIELFDAAAKRCTAVVGAFELQARAEWHFGTLEEWKTAPPTTIAAEIWSQGRALLVARIKDKQGSCGEVVFARVVGSSAAPVTPFQDATGALLTSARAKAIAILSPRAKGEDLSGLTGFRLARPRLAPSLAMLFLSVDPETCAPESSTSGELVWRVDMLAKPPTFTLISDQESSFHQALLMVDVDGDGELELIYKGWPAERVGMLKLGKAGYEHRIFVEIPYFNCPC